MAEQIKRKVPIQWIQTIKDDGTYEFTPDPNVYSTQKNVPSTNKIAASTLGIDTKSKGYILKMDAILTAIQNDFILLDDNVGLYGTDGRSNWHRKGWQKHLR